MSADQDWRQTWTKLRDYIAQEIRAALPFARDGKLDLSSNNIVGTVPPSRGGSGTNTGAEPALGNPAADGAVLSSTTAGVRSWVAPASALTNPMTTADDVIIGGSSGTPVRLAKGSNNTVFGVDGSGALGYKADPAGGGGGSTVSTGTLASRPAAGNSSALYFPTDAPYVYEDTGTAWQAYGPLVPMSPPVAANFSWANQGGATLDSSHGTLALYAPLSAGESLRLLTVAFTAGAQTVTACFDHLGLGVAGERGGICLYDSVSGKVLTFGNYGSTANRMLAENWNSVTSYNGNVFDRVAGLWPRWWRVAEASGTRTVSVSHDGQTWLAIYSAATGTFLTPNRVGIFAEASASPSAGTTIILRSWA